MGLEHSGDEAALNATTRSAVTYLEPSGHGARMKRADNLDRLWKDLVMVADFEYNSGFELLAERLSKNKRNDRIVSLNVQHRMHPKIAEFNSQVVYGNEYHSGSQMVERGFPTRLLGTPLKKDDSLILLDTSLFEGMEQLDEANLAICQCR